MPAHPFTHGATSCEDASLSAENLVDLCSSFVVLVHKHASAAPAARMMTISTLSCDSRQQKVPDLWYYHSLVSIHFKFCEDCVDKGRIYKLEDGCPLVKSLVYGDPLILMTNAVQDDKNEDVGAKAAISTLSHTPAFPDGSHHYYCFYWPFHLNKSMKPLLSTRFHSFSLDLMTSG